MIIQMKNSIFSTCPGCLEKDEVFLPNTSVGFERHEKQKEKNANKNKKKV